MALSLSEGSYQTTMGITIDNVAPLVVLSPTSPLPFRSSNPTTPTTIGLDAIVYANQEAKDGRSSPMTLVDFPRRINVDLQAEGVDLEVAGVGNVLDEYHALLERAFIKYFEDLPEENPARQYLGRIVQS